MWNVLHTFVPKHQYHIIRTSLEPNYYDPDTRILYATMDMVKEFVDITQHTIEWEDNEHHAAVWKELQIVYGWWTDKYPTREEELPDFPDVDNVKILGEHSEEHKDDADVIEWRRVADLHHKIEEEWDREEEEMLIRVMKLRKYLWY